MHSVPPTAAQSAQLVLAIDTCGPSGSVALGRLAGDSLEILGQIELEGRSYSSTLVAAIAELLVQSRVELKNVSAIIAVNGPGSFSGVRVGLSAVKGLAEPAQIPVVAVSRLEVLANLADSPNSALDAHRGEIFLRLATPTAHERLARELLAGAAELAAIPPPPRIAVCDDAAALLLASAWPAAELIRTPAPIAADALQLAVPRLTAGAFIDLALLDGHYLRRSDAEIFGAEISGAKALCSPAGQNRP
jgi:tRNA threonylcarbamoyladenosine biosynthesis protein TsaB